MSARQENERYRLSFRGELLEGQDAALVRRRVAALLKVDGARADALFSGRPVILRRDADRETAAKYQAAFRKAGAKLRVERAAAEAPASPPPPEAPEPRKATLAERLAAQAEAEGAPSAPRGSGTEAETTDHIGRDPAAPAMVEWTPTEVPARDEPAAEPARASAAAARSPGFTLAPVGADLLEVHERPSVEPQTVDVAHLRAESASLEDVSRTPAPPPAPDVSHLSLDAPGALLVAPQERPALELDLSALSLAEPGAVLPGLPRAPAAPVDAPALDVAEPGATLGHDTAPPAPPPPSTDHLELVRERARFDVD